MSDLEVRRAVRSLFQLGMEVEQVLDVVVDELLKSGFPHVRVTTSTHEGTTIRILPGRSMGPTVDQARVLPAEEQDDESELDGPVMEARIVVNDQEVPLQ